MLFAQQTLAQPFISSVQFDHNKGIELLRPSCSYSQLKNGMSGCTDAVREIQQGGEYQYLKSTQLVVRLNGSTPLPHSSYRLNVELIVHGGLWRTSSHQLCTSLEVQPNNELRECSRRIGPVVAAINVHIPGPLPRSRTLLSAQHHQRLDAYAVRMGHLAAAAKSIADIDVCSLDAAVLSQTVTKHACRRRGFQQSRLNGSIRMGVPELMASLKSSGLVETNLLREDWLPIATAFATAALSLPQPFTMVEVGNYCGGATLMFALLKRIYCPTCPFLRARRRRPSGNGARAVPRRPPQAARAPLLRSRRALSRPSWRNYPFHLGQPLRIQIALARAARLAPQARAGRRHAGGVRGGAGGAAPPLLHASTPIARLATLTAACAPEAPSLPP